jgi:ABC-type sugar transport system ATPase subunit
MEQIMSQVTLEQVTKSFDDTTVIPPIDLEIPDGSFTVFVGPSGCGKSTLLRMIAGLEEESSGTIRIGGTDVTGREPSKRGIAMVFQSYALYPHMTVAANIGFPLRMENWKTPEIEAAVAKAAETLQLTDHLDRKPKELSGGQRQRVAIGRAIVRNPKVFLFDEPLSNLDAALRGRMRVELKDLHRRMDATMIYVTHDQVEAMTLADQIVVLNGGRIEQAGTPKELYDRPQTEFVASFIGAPNMNLLKGPVAAQFSCETLGIRPEHLQLCTAEEADLTGQVHHAENLGAEVIAYVDTKTAGEVVVRLPGDTHLLSGSSVNMKLNPAKLHRFEGGRRMN